MKFRLLLLLFFTTWLARAQVVTTPALGEQISSELAQVVAATTPAAWLTAHADEKLELFTGRALDNDTQAWCARTVVSHSSNGHTWIRSVYFYDPEPPADDALPPVGASAQEALQTTCQFGLMWIEIPETDNSAGARLTEEIESSLQARYGSGQTPKFPGELTGFGAAYWTSAKRWQMGQGVLTVAYDQSPGKSHRVLVRLAFPNSDAFHDIQREMKDERSALLTWQDDVLHRIAQAGLAADATAEMKLLIEGPDYFSGKNRPAGDQVTQALRDWLADAKSRPSGQQAIALIVSDRVLDFLDHNGAGPDDATRAQLKLLGAEYVKDELAGGPVYAHTLLKQAKTIAPPGPASDEVLLYEMERGFDETGMCSSGAEEFKQVIENGESLLAVARALPASTLASLHFMVGDAYSTIVWLAMSGDDEYHDPKQYQPMKASARESALGHYRAAFELEHGTPRAQKEWKEAWRLAVGLAPTTEKYFCVYD